MLARQAWRLLIFPDSLCAKLLKAKYYPNSRLLDTAFPRNASNTWRAIEYGLALLKKGINWRVGNGKNIRIWRDNWVPRDYYLKPVTRRRRSRLKWVSDLIDEECAEWKTEVLHEHFDPVDVEEILKIKLSIERTEDIIAWHFERTGVFSVKSAYKLALNLRTLGANTSGSKFQNRSRLWNYIWKADVPPKVRIFAWRLAKNALPTNENKKARHILETSTCAICGFEAETAFHAVVSCPHARDLFEAMRTEWPVPDTKQLHLSGPDWLLLLLDRLPAAYQAPLLLILWRNWNDRNAVTHGGARLSIEESARALKSLQNTLYKTTNHTSDDIKGKATMNIFAREQKKEATPMNLAQKLRWQPPGDGWVKINIDGSFIESTGQASAGIVIRDQLGQVLLSS
ncbi:hypothetical protein PVAP13_7KG295601 [Panicum virgatum]|uniref:Reverse transcriptase zinc-binding domain-containing protein n=1 Tax=Panicum virgatum TaxID=38727 RepID=A0A8T0QM04_PANVG|nr:hypothetical protein PVAP13_7KG295601 [Panicum virgatum]